MKKSKKRAMRNTLKRIVVRIETPWGDQQVVSYGLTKAAAVAKAHNCTTGTGYRTISVN